MESRISEIERYLGIQGMDIKYFNAQEGETLNKKSQMLEEFIRAAEDKYFCLNELYAKFEKMESFLKQNEPFTKQCMDLKQKTNFIVDWLEETQKFLKTLEEVKVREKYLGFEPITDANKKMQELK